MSAARVSPTPSPVKMNDEKKVNAYALPSVDDERPKFLKDPFGWYAQLSYRRPRTMFATAWGFIFLLCAIGAPFFKQSDSGDYDWLLGRDSAIVQRSYSLKQVQERASQFTELAERTVPQTEQLFHLMYEARGSDNLLKPAMLKEMLEIEKVLFTDKRYAAYCVAEVADVNTCSADGYKSPLTLFYTISITRDGNNQTVYSADPISCQLSPQQQSQGLSCGGGANFVDTEAGIKAKMALVLASASGPKAKLWFDAGFNEDGVSTDARYMQAFYFLGMPLDGYSNPADRNEEQRVPGNAMLLDASDALKLRFGMKETWSKSSFQTEATVATADGEMKVYWWSLPGQENEWQTLSSKDLNFTVLSFLGVMVYVAYHTGSIIISATSMLMTVTSIFVAFFWFRVVFQVSFFQFINFLIIFVVLGIGADDVFVFMDAFHQSIDELRAKNKPATLPHRIKHTMRRALHAIFVTSFTTSAAFCATALSPLIPLRSFGLFSALVIFCVFGINAVVLPPLTVLYIRNLHGRGWIGSAKAIVQGMLPCTVFTLPVYEDPGLKLPDDEDKAMAASTDPADKYNVKHMRMTERFFYVRYFNFLNSPAKYVILAAFAGLFAGGVALWVSLEVPKEPEQWFPKTHMFQQYQDMGSDKIMMGGSGADTLDVSLVWGLSGLNTKGTDPWKPSDLGDVIYDAGFDPSTAAAQAHLMKSYESLKTAACGAKACSGGKLADPLVTIRNIVAETDATGAVIGGFYKYLNDLGGAYASSHPVNAPVTSDTFNVQMCKYSKLDATKVRYAGHVGYYVKDCDASPVPSAKFILIEATSSIRMPQAPVDFTEAQDDWEVFGNSLDVGAPAELTGAEATSTNIFWLWSVTSISLMDNVYLGLAVCFPMVFFVLSVSTGNVILAFYSTVTIAGIVTTVIGIGAGGIMGWDLGTTEAIAAVIVIGFSVDYCVHLANAYIENDAVDRVSRTRIALTTMGISVTAGAITTIIAGAFLAFCILTFFVKFAFLICWTIFSSYIWAVIFFGALCMTAGPSGKFGDISWLLAKMFPWCH